MKLNSTLLFSMALTFLTLTTLAQNDPGWQWALRGGSAATFDYGYTRFDFGMERILDVAVDNDNNYYYLAEVAGHDFTLGGLDYEEAEYEFETYIVLEGFGDMFVSSTDSGGNYSWSKTIGGRTIDFAGSVVVNDQNGIYVSGTTYNYNGKTPVHFDTDSIMAEGTDD